MDFRPTFLCLVHKLFLILTALDYKPHWKMRWKIYMPWVKMAGIQYIYSDSKWNWPFLAILLTIYMFIFHKTEVWTVILRCIMGLKSDWFKSYDAKCKYFHFQLFAILYKNTRFRFLCFLVLCYNFCTN